MDIFDKVYYIRALAGVAAGVIAGFVIPMEYDQNTSVLVVLLIAILLYVMSYVIGKEIARNVPKEKRRKVATDGIIPFIFLLFTFMIIVYTALHQSIPIK